MICIKSFQAPTNTKLFDHNVKKGAGMEFHMSSMMRGIILMSLGLILLLNTLGIVERAFTAILIVVSVCMIVYGFYVSNLYSMIREMFKKQ